MTTTSSTTSGTISSLGVGSGLDSNAIVSKLVDLERQPISTLQSKAAKIQTQISAFGQIQSAISTVRDAASKLANPDIWSTTTATSTDSAAVTFSTSAGAATGTYNVTVGALAASQSVVMSTPLSAASNTVGAGSLTIDVGSWANGSFTAKSGATPVSITVAATDTLEAIRDKINSAGAGVSAAIITDTTGARLVMNSSSTGAANGFRITAAETGAAGLSSLAYDPANATAGTALTQTAADATATINGVPVTSASNTFSSVLSGITFTVGKLVPALTPVSVQVAQDNAAISKAVTDFATAYSALATLLKNDTKYDDATKTGGTLQGDSTAVGLINQFRSVLGSSTTASSVFTTLSSVGLQIQTGGNLTVNTTKLNSALGNLAEVKKLFSNASGGSGAEGIATRVRTLSDTLTGFEGALTSRTAGLNKAVANNQKQQDALDARASLYEARLKAQYTALDKTMAGISGTSGYVTQMITAWNKSS